MKTLRTKRWAEARRFTVEPWDLETRLMLSAAADGALLVQVGSQAGSQLVNQVGNKTRELEVTSAAAGQLYTSAVTAQQSESGVNLDEEAANLMKYQQAYQAAVMLMKTASDMFDVLLSLGA